MCSSFLMLGIVVGGLLFDVRAFRTRPSLGEPDHRQSRLIASDPSSSPLFPNAADLKANQYIQAIHNPIFKTKDRQLIERALRSGPYYGPLHCSSVQLGNRGNRTKYAEGFWLKLDGHLDRPLTCIKVTCPNSGKSEDIGFEFMADCGPAAPVLYSMPGQKPPHVEGLRLLESHLLFQIRKGNGFHYMWSNFGRHREPQAKDQGIVDLDFLTEHPHGYSQPHVGLGGKLFAKVPTSTAWTIIDGKTCAALKDQVVPDVSTKELFEQCVSQEEKKKEECHAAVQEKMKGGWEWYKKQRKLPKQELIIYSCDQYLKSSWIDHLLGISGWDDCEKELRSRLESKISDCGRSDECQDGLTKLECLAEVPLPIPSERRTRT